MIYQGGVGDAFFLLLSGSVSIHVRAIREDEEDEGKDGAAKKLTAERGLKRAESVKVKG